MTRRVAARAATLSQGAMHPAANVHEASHVVDDHRTQAMQRVLFCLCPAGAQQFRAMTCLAGVEALSDHLSACSWDGRWTALFVLVAGETYD